MHIGLIIICLMLISTVNAWHIGKNKRDKERCIKREAERKEREDFEKQKVKVKLISGYLTPNVEKEVNRFIRDKKVLNVTFDDNRCRVTATILYEDL